MQEEKNKKCKCGKTIKDDTIIHECKYTGVGWLLFSIGLSAKPSEVIFKCINCGEVYLIDKSEETLKKYVGR